MKISLRIIVSILLLSIITPFIIFYIYDNVLFLFISIISIVVSVLFVTFYYIFAIFKNDKIINSKSIEEAGLHEMVCLNCNKINVKEDQYCIFCGERLGENDKST